MTKTQELMSRNLITIKASDFMAEAYRIMHTHNIRHLPVVDEREKVVGILSDRDVQKAMNVQRINNFQQTITIDETRKVEDFMSWPVFNVSETTSIQKVVEEMLAQKVSAFIVCDNLGQHRGIITTDDLLNFLLEMLKSNEEIKLKPLSHYFFQQV